jgi:predicted transcriptional regulator
MRSESMPDLGDLEREVMQLIWANGRLTAEFVRERLARRLKESTVRTVLRRDKFWFVIVCSQRTKFFIPNPLDQIKRSAIHKYSDMEWKLV